jgi:hypothetical protein
MLPSTANKTKILIDDTLGPSPVKELLQNSKGKPSHAILLLS